MDVDASMVVSIQCSSCKGKIRLGDERCAGCGRKVTPDERDALRRRWEASSPEAAKLRDAVAYGRATLLLVAGLSFVEGLIYGVIAESTATFVCCAVISASMVALFFWARRQPLTAAILGLAIFLTLQALAVAASPVALLQGILLKVVVLLTFVAGISAELNRRHQEKRSLQRRRSGG